MSTFNRDNHGIPLKIQKLVPYRDEYYEETPYEENIRLRSEWKVKYNQAYDAFYYKHIYSGTGTGIRTSCLSVLPRNLL